jgi:hypothetical protein
MTIPTRPRPTSSRPRPATRDDLPQVTSSLVPLSSMGTRSPEPSKTTNTTPPTSSPGRGQS